MKATLRHIIVFIFVSGFCTHLYADSVEIISPNKRVKIIFDADSTSHPSYSVYFDGKSIILKSRLGLVFKGNDPLGKNMKLNSVKESTFDETYQLYAGKSNSARNHYYEKKVELQETSGQRRKLNLYFRAYDDGAAFRYELPEQDHIRKFELVKEATEFNFSQNAKCWAMTSDVAGYRFDYERDYNKSMLNDLPKDKYIPFPITIKMGSTYMLLSEANINDYSGMYLKKYNSRSNSFRTVLAPRREYKDVSVISLTPHKSPWRALILGTNPGNLIESNLIINLNEPNAIDDVSWIKPGKSFWDWWASWVDFDKDFKYGMNTETMKYFIDIASANGIEYLTIDATWYDYFDATVPIKDLPKKNLLKSVPEIDIPLLASYGNSKNVGIFIWMHWKHLEDQMEEALDYFERIGIKGLKIDFTDGDDQEMINYYHRICREAAKHKLMINFHGSYKPDGLRRTYPNLITREALRGEEHSRWDELPTTPSQNVTLPYTRMVVGPMDYTPGGLRVVLPGQQKRNMDQATVIGTTMHQVSKIIVYESPLMTMCEGPIVYNKAPIFSLIKQIPSSWEETKVLDGEIGKYIVIARKKDQKWYIGIMSDWTPRKLDVLFNFLPIGDFKATIYSDIPSSTDMLENYKINETTITNSSKLNIYIAPGGGAVIILEPK